MKDEITVNNTEVDLGFPSNGGEPYIRLMEKGSKRQLFYAKGETFKQLVADGHLAVSEQKAHRMIVAYCNQRRKVASGRKAGKVKMNAA
jgi:hypothetical protein